MTKPTKWHVCPAKTGISLGIRPVWSESSLCAQWVAKNPSFLHADSGDWSDWADFVGFVMRRLNYCNCNPILLKQSPWASIDSDFIWNGQRLKRSMSYSNQPKCIDIWATSWENLFMPYVNNKDTDQPAPLRRLISAYVVRCPDSIIYIYLLNLKFQESS